MLTSSYPGWIKSPHVVTLGILKLSDLDSDNFHKGGYSGVNFGHPKSEVFWNGGGGAFLVFNSRKGLSGKFGPKFTVQPETCLCITVVSHILRMWRLIKCRNIYFDQKFKGLFGLEANWLHDTKRRHVTWVQCTLNNFCAVSSIIT